MVKAVVAGSTDKVVEQIHKRAAHFARLVEWSLWPDGKSQIPSPTGGCIFLLKKEPYTPLVAKLLFETADHLIRARHSGAMKKAFGLVRERIRIAGRFASSYHGIAAELAEEVLEQSKPYSKLFVPPNGSMRAARMMIRNRRHHSLRARTAFGQLARIGADPQFVGLSDLLEQEYEDVCAGRYGETTAKPLKAREAVARVTVQWQPEGNRKGCILVSTPGQVEFRVQVGGARKCVEIIDKVAHLARRALRKHAKSSGRTYVQSPIAALPVDLSQAQKTRLLQLFQIVLRVTKLERDDLFEKRGALEKDGQGDVCLRFQVQPSELAESGFHERAGMVKSAAFLDDDADDLDSSEEFE